MDEEPEMISFHHVQLTMPVGQEGAAERFYAGTLGLERTPKPDRLATRGGCWFRSTSGAVELHLGVEQDFRPARKAHPALLVDGLDDLRRRLEEAGTPVQDDIQLEGYDRLYAFDPFGNRLEFIEAR